MKPDLAKLRELAAKATPGPWFQAYARVVSEPLSADYMRIEKSWGDDVLADEDPRWHDLPEPDVCYFSASHGDTLTGQALQDANYVAAASPDVVIALLDEIGRLTRERAELVSDLVVADKRDDERREAWRKVQIDRLATDGENIRLRARLADAHAEIDSLRAGTTCGRQRHD